MALLLHLLLIYKFYTHLGKRFVCATRVRVFRFYFLLFFLSMLCLFQIVKDIAKAIQRFVQ